MNNSQKTPFYLSDPKCKFINANRWAIEAGVNSQARMLGLDIAPEIVQLKDTRRAQEIVLALQHYPWHIEKMVGILHFNFVVKAGSHLCLPEQDWKRNSIYRRWFHRMAGVEVMPFFVKDKDVRLYMLAGDYMAKGKADITKEEREGGRIKYVIKGGMIPELCKRLSASCLQFMLFCHNTGFDPKDAIVSMLNDYTLPVHYIDILKEYDKEIKNRYRFIAANDWVYRFRAA